MFKASTCLLNGLLRSQVRSRAFTKVHCARNVILRSSFSTDLVADWPDAIKTFLKDQKIDQPTPIQEKTLPIAMENQDLVGIARTGSGKTLAFVIPAVMKILKERESNRPIQTPTCLVLAPTRELAGQTADVFKKFRHLGIRSLVLVGGASRAAQIAQLEDGNHHVYIATPGRLQDLIDSREVDLSSIKYLVLDEADRMLDMGFEPQIRRIVKSMPSDRQTLMWSATWPREIQHLAEDFMTNYKQVAVDSEKLKANPNIKQLVEFCEPRSKFTSLLKHLQSATNDKSKCLIFVNTKRLADNIMFQLMKHRMKAISLHGDRSQRQRDEAVRHFKQGNCLIMIATDVAARGLDIDDIKLVINYDMPKNIEDYIHRIGRTARHNKEGTAVSLFTDNDANIARKLMQVLKETDQDVPPMLKDFAHERTRLRSYI